MGRFSGRRAIVTGASRGIGVGVAERLAAEGADVAIVARTATAGGPLDGSLGEVAERLRKYGTTITTITADLSNDEHRAGIVPAAVAGLGGPIDVLVNNAAAAIYDTLEAFPLRRRRVMFEVNVHAPLDLMQAVIPSMRELGAGWILNVSSRAATPWDGPPFEPGALGSTITEYGASKAALNRITNGMAAELQATGIRVNGIEPRAAVMTAGADALVGDQLRADQLEPLEAMVEAAVALCDCPTTATGIQAISLDLIDEWGLEVRQLDGSAR